MDLEELEDGISCLEDSYSEIEETINMYLQMSQNPNDRVILDNILDGVQYFINEITYKKEQEEIKIEKDWNNR